jgi:hypothetical protein
MPRVLFCLFLALQVPGAFSLPDQKLIYPGEWAYDALTVLSLEQRIVFFSGSMLTVGQFKSMLAEIDGEALSPAGKRLYGELEDYLTGRAFLSLSSGALSIDVDPSLTAEFYARTNKNLDYIYDNNKRRPFLALPFSLSFSPYVTAEMDVAAEQKLEAAFFKDNYTNFPTGDGFNFNIPKRAYLSMGLPFKETAGIQFRIGIGENFFGRTQTGSIILSDYMKDATYGSLSIYSPALKYSGNVMQLDVNKYFYFHQLEMRFFKRVSLSAVEGLMVNAPMELRFLNPVMIYHSFSAYSEYGDYNGGDPEFEDNDSRIASFFGMKVELQFFKNVRLYGLWALNEMRTAGEQADGIDALKPDSMAFQWGGEAFIPSDRGYWSFGLEGVYTYPYVYILRNKNWSFYKPKTNKSGNVEFWTGTPLGPDTAAASLWAGFHASRWSLSASFLFAAQGERSGLDIFNGDAYHPWRTYKESNYTDLDKALGEVNLVSPTGTPAFTYQISFAAKWQINKWLAFSCDPGYKIINNYHHEEGRIEHGFEAAFGFRFIPPPLNLKFK